MRNHCARLAPLPNSKLVFDFFLNFPLPRGKRKKKKCLKCFKIFLFFLCFEHFKRTNPSYCAPNLDSVIIAAKSVSFLSESEVLKKVRLSREMCSFRKPPLSVSLSLVRARFALRRFGTFSFFLSFPPSVSFIHFWTVEAQQK